MYVLFKKEVLDISEKSWGEIQEYFDIGSETFKITGKFWDIITHDFVHVVIIDDRGLRAALKLDKKRFDRETLTLTINRTRKRKVFKSVVMFFIILLI